MRDAFIHTLENEAQINKKIILLTGDLGFTVFEKFKEKFPKRFINAGVAEANMLGLATGLALSGKIPFVYSIASFIVLRPLEQIRNDVCMHKANVKIIGVGSGIAYSNAGPTHHSNEDLAIMRSLPNMTVICPADPLEVKQAIIASIKLNGPVYIRLGKKGEKIIHQKIPQFRIGKGIVIKKGNDIALISCGSIINNVIQTAEILESKGFSSAVISLHTIKPIDKLLLKLLFKNTKFVFTIEEHNIIGGLGSAVSEILAELNPCKTIFKRIGINDEFCLKMGDYEYMRNQYSLSAKKIASTILNVIKK